MRVVMMIKMSWQVNEEVSRDMTGEADGVNQGVDSRDRVIYIWMSNLWFSVGKWFVGELNRDKIVKIARLTGCKNFVGKWRKFILYSMRLLTLHQWRDLRMGVICEDLGAFSTARARFRKCRDLVWEGKVFVKNKAKVTSRVGCSERREFFRQSAKVEIDGPLFFRGHSHFNLIFESHKHSGTAWYRSC